MHSPFHRRQQELFVHISSPMLDLGPSGSVRAIRKQYSNTPAAVAAPAEEHLGVEHRPFGGRCYRFLAEIGPVLGYS